MLVATRLDRLARSTRDLLELRDRIKKKGVQLNVLNLGDTGTETGEPVFTVIGAIAQFERALMLRASARRRSWKANTRAGNEKLGEIHAPEQQGVS